MGAAERAEQAEDRGIDITHEIGERLMRDAREMMAAHTHRLQPTFTQADVQPTTLSRETLVRELQEQKMKQRKHSHYFRDVSRLKVVDVYRVLLLFGVTDPALQHIIKKALCAGQRGVKDFEKDVQEIRDTAQRRLDMMAEDREQDRE